MRIELIPARQLSAELRTRWSATQTAQPELASPFFCPQFTELVAAYHDDVLVALLENGGEIGFFPFQLTGIRSAQAPGGKLCDYQGVIAPAGLQWTGEELLSGCHLDSYRYKRMLPRQIQFSRYHTAFSNSAIMEIQQGFDVYSRRVEISGSAVLKKVALSRKKLERDHGPVKYAANCVDPEVLDWLLASKSAQYRRTGLADQFQPQWVTSLLRRLHAISESDFGGMLSVLWAGDQIAAAHLGLRARHVLHYWFPCYSVTLRNYSPGLILLSEMARSASECGISVIDLGRADAPYKRRFMTGGVEIAEGVAELATASEREQAYCAHTSGVHT